MTPKSDGRVDLPPKTQQPDQNKLVAGGSTSTRPSMEPIANRKVEATEGNGVAKVPAEANAVPDPKSKVTHSRKPASYAGSYPDRARDTDLQDGALFRKGEMVWAELPQPIRDATGGDRLLTHWPGLITARTIKSTSQVVAPSTVETGQHFEYHISLLACSDEFRRREDQIKPWLAFPPPNDIATVGIDNPESVKFVWDGKQSRLAKLEEFTIIQQATTAFALGLQIAAHIIASFTFS
jgi:hypothetical protein